MVCVDLELAACGGSARPSGIATLPFLLHCDPSTPFHPLNAYVVQCSSRWLTNQYLASLLMFLAPPSADPAGSIAARSEHAHCARRHDHQRFGGISKTPSSSSHFQPHGAFNRRADNMASFPTGAHRQLKPRKVTKSRNELRFR